MKFSNFDTIRKEIGLIEVEIEKKRSSSAERDDDHTQGKRKF